MVNMEDIEACVSRAGEPRKHHAIDVFFFLTGQAESIRTALLYGSLFQGWSPVIFV